jgi:hypothetical protein
VLLLGRSLLRAAEQGEAPKGFIVVICSEVGVSVRTIERAGINTEV